MLTLTLDALDESDLHAQLRARQLMPVSVARAGRLALGRSRQGGRFDVALFAQELHALVHAGLSLVESLEGLAEKANAVATRTVLDRLLAALREGQRFSAALRAQGAQFSPLFVGIVEAAESTGELAPALERYLSYDRRVQAVRQRLLSAAIYPAILLTVGALVALFLMGWVVPRFAAVYQGTGRALPWGSQLLLDWGQFAGAHTGALLIGFVAVAGAAAWKLRAALRDADAARLLAWLPGVPRWIELLTLSRLYLTLGLLLQGGLPIQAALALAASVLPAARQARIAEASQRIGEGQSLSAAFETCGLVTPIALRFIRAGERSGQLAQMLHRAALYHDAETSRWVERFSKTFEPLLMAAIGLVIGIIVLLLYMPIFDLAGSLQ
ncbi:type II secretion system F family protein [Pseudaquabacterium terrae]|nr:type II secretion system F family protein [Aquabacterium terrae]